MTPFDLPSFFWYAPHVSGGGGGALMDMLVKELEGDMTEAEHDEETSQDAIEDKMTQRLDDESFQGWLRDTKKKGVIEFDAFQTLEVVEPDECDIDESFQRCPDVVRLGAQGVTWLGFKKTGRAKLQATSIAMELVNLHRRVLTRGDRKSVV